jgi:hypothetical protein
LTPTPHVRENLADEIRAAANAAERENSTGESRTDGRAVEGLWGGQSQPGGVGKVAWVTWPRGNLKAQ